MKTRLSHLQFNVNAANLRFYHDLFAFLGWQILDQFAGSVIVGPGDHFSIWFYSPAEDVKNHYNGPGLNHLAIGTESVADVDATVAFLRERGITGLFETPRHNPEWMTEENDYYQIIFTSPDNILFEVVYEGPLNT